MKNNIIRSLAGLLVVFSASCSKIKTFEEPVLPNVAVSLVGVNGRLLVPTGNNFSKTQERVTIPVKMALNGTAPKLFSVSVAAKADTINTLIGNGTLTNTLLLPLSSFVLPNLAEIPFGSDSASVELSINMLTIEKYYGKNLAIAITISNPTKGNTLSATKKTVLVIINTSAVIMAADVHKTSLVGAGAQLIVPTGLNYSKDNNDITVPLSSSYTGSLGSAFSVSLAANQDTVNKLIANNTLTNTVSVSSGFTLPATVDFPAATNAVTFNIKMAITALQLSYPKKIAFAVTMSSPTKYLLDEAKKTIIMVFDPVQLVEKDWTSTYLQNAKRPFIASSKETAGRWGKLADWTVNAAANNRTGGFGSYDNNNSTNIAMESGNGATNMTNGKIYQTVTLPAGKYRFDVILRTGTAQSAYVAVAVGNILPDVANVPTGTLGNALLSTATTISVPFTLAASTQVSMGFVATLTGNQSVNVQDVKLFQVP